MDEYDRANLKFLLSANDEVLADWFAKMTEDDAKYAISLLAYAKTEIDAYILNTVDQVDDVCDARRVLEKFIS